ncbi:hypothetical protein V500_07884 [Pseudogymnoascus sp. VKM F-4518 (FW-2643)]|nr:hypothetical protein V500_07884 [Pseudogymnoascus sp. VKM F-4518 (FW-2643)]
MADLNQELRKPDSSSDVEKIGTHDEDLTKNTPDAESTDPRITQFTHAEQRKIIHRIDRRLVITLGIMYSISLMDRANVSKANIAGMSKDLKFATPGVDRYSVIVLIFFIPYVLFQPPATVIMRKLGPRRFLPTICVLWGGVMIAFGFVNNWTEMVGLRVILGVLEAGFFPGCAYLMSTWFTRFELHKRYSIFYLIGSGASAFAGILAYGLIQMDGVANIKGWRWIFIIEGVVTCAVGLASYFILVDFPDQAKGTWKFLSDAEVDLVIARLEYDRADSSAPAFHLGSYLRHAADLKIWGFASLFGLCTVTTYAISYFLPVILMQGMGFNLAQAQCLVAPPYACAGIYMYTQAIFADKFRNRALPIMMNSTLCLIGLPILGFSTNNGARYFGVFLATIGSNSNIPAVMTYQANNIRALSFKFKRANKRVDAGGKMIEGQIIVRNQPVRANMYVALRPESRRHISPRPSSPTSPQLHCSASQIRKPHSMKAVFKDVISETRAMSLKERRVRSTWLKLEHTALAIVEDDEEGRGKKGHDDDHEMEK